MRANNTRDNFGNQSSTRINDENALLAFLQRLCTLILITLLLIGEFAIWLPLALLRATGLTAPIKWYQRYIVMSLNLGAAVMFRSAWNCRYLDYIAQIDISIGVFLFGIAFVIRIVLQSEAANRSKLTKRNMAITSVLLPTEAQFSEVRMTELPEVACCVCGDNFDSSPVFCEGCRTPFHKDCWRYVGECSVFGCGSKRKTRLARRT